MDRLATALTNAIRSSPSSEMISGSVYNQVAFISVQWAQLTLPLALLILSGVFLLSTILRTLREHGNGSIGIWETSALATLVNGLPEDVQQEIKASGAVGTPRTKARGMKVGMHPQQGWRESLNAVSSTAHEVRFVSPNQPPPGWI
jgi:hypothetical protein